MGAQKSTPDTLFTVRRAVVQILVSTYMYCPLCHCCCSRLYFMDKQQAVHSISILLTTCREKVIRYKFMMVAYIAS